MSDEETTLEIRMNMLSKMCVEERLRTLELAVIFLLREHGVFVTEEGAVYSDLSKRKVPDEIITALSIIGDME